jgi:hypothetical protein
MRKVKLTLSDVITLFPEMENLGNLPRKKKKMMKKNFSKVLNKKFNEWLENGRG